MQVVKRNGEKQPIDFEKIHWRIKSMCAKPEILNFQKELRPDSYNVLNKLPPISHADVDTITKKTIEGLYNNMSTTEIDSLSAEVAQEMCVIHPDNSVLATRILVSNIQKNILEVLVKCFPYKDRKEIRNDLFKFSMRALYSNLDKQGRNSPLIAPYILRISEKYSERINNILDYSRDFTNHDYLGIRTLEKSYLFRFNSLDTYSDKNVIIESPSMSDMRIAIGIVCAPTPCPTIYDLGDVEVTEYQWNRIEDIYNGMTKGKFTPATPTRFSSGTLKPQGSSCFLIAMQDDSLRGIYNTLIEQSQISKYAGGVGLWCHNVRSTGSYISGTNGHSNGLKPMLKVFNASAEYVDQGGNKRPGSAAIYLEPWHSDIIDFIRLKRKKGADSDRARSLFYALWIPDEFFRCWKVGKPWYLFDPSLCPKLYNSYDEEFSSEYLTDDFVKQNKVNFLFTYRYRKYVKQGKHEKKIMPEELMEEVVDTVKESGIPYMLSKDACNRKSNQKNLGVIKSSNLCCEIIQYSDSENTAVCNLSSICLNKFVKKWNSNDSEEFKYNVSLNDNEEYMTFDFEDFAETVKTTVKNIDRLIDLNFYPTENSKNSNLKTRPQALGIQGEADLLAMLRLPWNSKEAHKLRFAFMERMYYEALKTSLELSKENGPYPAFPNSPASKGKLQFDLWKDEGKKISFKFRMQWDELKTEIQKYGLRNSLLIGPMPTASTSSIMGNSPSIEPFNSLVYIRKAGSIDITVINNNLVNDLMSLNLWSKEMSNKILSNDGSIQDILEIPKKVRNSYLTVYDLEPSDIIDAAFVRGWFVDQSQSMNLFFKNVTMSELSKAWTRGWNRGLKTLSYYCRTRSAVSGQKTQVKNEKMEEVLVCDRNNPDCLSCGS